jgi:CHAT domain-containing protein
MEVFVGRHDGLSSLKSELSLLASLPADGFKIHQPCHRQNWHDAHHDRIWHYYGHASYRSDNPFFSSLSLEDGPFFAADFRLMKNPVGLVTLSACRTGCQSAWPGEESVGLVRSLLEMGARSVVGSHWNVADKSTALWMREFYESVFDGQSVAESVRLASMFTRDKYPAPYHWAAFSVFGAG